MNEPNPIRVNMTIAESNQSVDMTLAENGTVFPMQHSEVVISTSTDYDDLFNKPQINGVELVGDKTGEELGLQASGDYATNTALQTGLSGKQDTISDLDTIRSGAALGATAVQHEVDPTVPSWAKASSKPTYTASEVGALPDSTTIPSKTSQLQNDSGFITSAPVTSVNGRTGAVTGLAEASDIPTVPTNVSAFNNDAKYLHGNTKGSFYGTSTTSASTGEKAVSCSDFASSDRTIGAVIYVMFGHTNTADVSTLKLNVNSTGAKSIKMMQNGSLVNLPSSNFLQTGMVYPFYFDGDYWVCLQNHFPVNVSELTNDSGYVDSAQAASAAPVQSVNGQTGSVSLTIPTVPTDVSSFNNDAGYLTLSTLPIYNGGVS